MAGRVSRSRISPTRVLRRSLPWYWLAMASMSLPRVLPITRAASAWSARRGRVSSDRAGAAEIVVGRAGSRLLSGGCTATAARSVLPIVGHRVADVDLAMRLVAGYRATFEPGSRVIAAAPTRAQSAGRGLARRTPVLETCQAFGVGRGRWSPMPDDVATEIAMCVVRPLRVGCVLGRAAGIFEHAFKGRAEFATQPDRPQPEPTQRADLRLDPAVSGGFLREAETGNARQVA